LGPLHRNAGVDNEAAVQLATNLTPRPQPAKYSSPPIPKKKRRQPFPASLRLRLQEPLGMLLRGTQRADRRGGDLEEGECENRGEVEAADGRNDSAERVEVRVGDGKKRTQERASLELEGEAQRKCCGVFRES